MACPSFVQPNYFLRTDYQVFETNFPLSKEPNQAVEITMPSVSPPLNF
jgi:hypothetical protein